VQGGDLDRALGPVFFKPFAGVLQPGELLAAGRGCGGGWDRGGRGGRCPQAGFRAWTGGRFLELAEALLALIFGSLSLVCRTPTKRRGRIASR